MQYVCMYSKCENCRDVKLKVACREHMQISDIENCKVCSSGSLKLLKPFDPHEIVTYNQWVLKTEECDIGKQSRVMTKELTSVSMFDLICKLENSLIRLKKHVFNIRHQFLQYRDIRKNMTDTECLLH